MLKDAIFYNLSGNIIREKWACLFFLNFSCQSVDYQWRILMVFKVFSEHPDVSKKYFFSTFYNLFLFFVIFVIYFFVQKVNFTTFPFKII